MGKLLGELGKSKISYFCFSIMNKYIGYFQIPVYNVLLRQVLQSRKNILNDGLCNFLCQMMFLSQLRLQIPLITQLRNNITIPIARKHLKTSKYIRMIEFLQYINLRKQQLL